MKTIERKVYYCDYCNKHGLSKGSMSRHEKYCNQNPNNLHKCFKYCIHLKKTKELETYIDEYPIYRTRFTCAVTKQNMFSYLAEKSRFVSLKSDEIRMPIECNLYEDESDHDFTDDIF